MNKQTLLTRGFTLIELLVVIAIIGILAAVVIGSLNDARSGGQDASIKQSVANIRSQAELFYNSNGYTYSVNATNNVCYNAATDNLLSAAVDVVNGTDYVPGTHGIPAARGANSLTGAAGGRLAACHADETRYVAISPLATVDASFWCVDSTGYSGSSTALTADTDFTCNP